MRMCFHMSDAKANFGLKTIKLLHEYFYHVGFQSFWTQILFGWAWLKVWCGYHYPSHFLYHIIFEDGNSFKRASWEVCETGKKKKKKSGHFQHIFASQITKMHYSFICLGGESKAIAVDPMKDNDTNLIHFDEFDWLWSSTSTSWSRCRFSRYTCFLLKFVC